MLYERGIQICPYSNQHNTKMCPVGNYQIVSGKESNPYCRNQKAAFAVVARSEKMVSLQQSGLKFNNNMIDEKILGRKRVEL
jgi:hypothetical protein